MICGWVNSNKDACTNKDVVAVCARCGIPLCRIHVKDFNYAHGYLCLGCKAEEMALTLKLVERSF